MTITATEKLTRKESLKLFELTLNNPFAERIDYTISQEYVSSLKEYWGIKELIANFRDANGADFYMDYEQGSLIMSDENTGIDIKYMIIGNSGSREETSKIGEHGEGMKIGALTLVRLGYKVLIHTVGYTIAFGLEYSELLETDLMYAKYTENDKTLGTDIFIECKKSEFNKARQMFLSLIEHEEITENIIDLPNKVKDIYLNGLSHVQKKAVFGYNLKQKGLISNRDRNFIQQSILDESIISFYNELTNQTSISKIMTRFLDERKNFEKMLEARFVERFDFDDDLKAKFKSTLPKKTYFVRSQKDTLENSKQTPMIVDEKLFTFLEYLGANVVKESGDFESFEAWDGELTDYGFEEDEVLVHSFVFEKTTIPNELELEKNIAGMISLNGKMAGEQAVYSLETYPEFGELDMIRLKPALKAQKRLYRGELGHLFSNLLFLSVYGADVIWHTRDAQYRLIETKNADKVIVLIAKKAIDSNKPYVSITKMTPFPKGQNFVKEEQSYIYLFDLRYEAINALYSYRIENMGHQCYWGQEKLEGQISEGVSQIIEKLSLTNAKEFFGYYLASPKDMFYERNVEMNTYKLSKKQKQIRKIFDKLHPNMCLAERDNFYNEAVIEQYSYDVLEEKYDNFYEFLDRFLEIPTSSAVFAAKQNEAIYTVPYNEPMKQAVKLFKELVPTDIKIELADILPDAKESHHQNDTIYISRLSSEIPEFLAALILYEHEQIIVECATPSHKLQSRLTHYPIGRSKA